MPSRQAQARSEDRSTTSYSHFIGFDFRLDFDAPLASILLTTNMGCTLFRMTPEEALAGVTSHAAQALGLDDTGVIAPGNRADLAVWDVAQPAELAYRIGFNPLNRRIFGGEG